MKEEENSNYEVRVYDYWSGLIDNAPEGEQRYQAVVYYWVHDFRIPNNCVMRGTYKECAVAAMKEEMRWNEGMRERYSVSVEPVTLDEYGDETSFGEQVEEFWHCYEMGDFDEY